jgi:hypothetical protein
MAEVTDAEALGSLALLWPANVPSHAHELLDEPRCPGNQHALTSEVAQATCHRVLPPT